jgi:hypothetical protein
MFDTWCVSIGIFKVQYLLIHSQALIVQDGPLASLFGVS